MQKSIFHVSIFAPTSAFLNVTKVSMLFVFAFLLLGCQTTPLDVYYAADEEVDLTHYDTFSVQSINDDSNINRAITQGIESELAKKGYQHSDQAELIFAFSLEINESETLKQTPISIKGNTFTRTSLEAVYEAKMLINAIDVSTKQVVWKASTSRDIRSVGTKSIDQNRINERMAELLYAYPAR